MALDPQELRSRLRGIISFGITPFHDDYSLNFEALRRNAAELAASSDVLVALGNNGEIFSLSPEEQKQVGRAVIECVNGQRPVVMGVGFCLPVSTDLARAAESAGAAGVLALPPHYTNSTDEGLFEYYRAIAASTRLGVILFQTPGLNFSPALLDRLSRIPNIVGLKDEHGDLKQFVRQWRAVGDRMELLCGVGEILAPSYFALGVRAFTSGIINFMPATPLQVLKLLGEGRLQDAARVIEREAIPIYDMRGRRPGYQIVVIKEAMNLCGFPAGPVRPPLAPMAAADRNDLRAILEGLGVVRRS